LVSHDQPWLQKQAKEIAIGLYSVYYNDNPERDSGIPREPIRQSSIADDKGKLESDKSRIDEACRGIGE
jgi:hypothetical protein